MRTKLLLLLLFVPVRCSAQTYTESILYTFSGNTDGAHPLAGLVMDSSGTLYGTTWEGGNSSVCDGFGCGTIFKVAASGEETVLYAFAGGADGAIPEAPVIRDSQGNLYGTALAGGYLSYCGGFGSCGVVFKLDSAGAFTVLHTFTGAPDGALPQAGLIQDAKGNLYGTTQNGGTFSDGAVFKIDASGHETVLYSFREGADGGLPEAGLIRDAAGNLLSTTLIGGTTTDGTVFKVDPSGNETVLYAFTGVSGDGAAPSGGLVANGTSLYGTTRWGGPHPAGEGTVFKLDKNGKETVLHAFSGPDGANPVASLIHDAAGNLYGTTLYGGSLGLGTVFEINTSGKATVLHNFTAGTDGSQPYGALIRDSAGNLYGTTSEGGVYGLGTVFKLTKNK